MSNSKMTAGIYTLGCKVNQYESEAIAEELQKRGFTLSSPSSECDVYIINTCTVTAESDRKARQFIRRAMSKNPQAFIIVTGCLAQTAQEKLAKIKGIDAIVGNSQKLLCADIALELVQSGEKPSSPQIHVSDINSSDFEEMHITKFDRTRAYVKIEDGCESHCTYCIIPAARGKIRSKRPESVIAEVGELVKGGCFEVVLTGIETASYGKDLPCTSFADLLCEVDAIDGIGRVRLGSLDPASINENLVKKIAPLSSLAPHFHLSLQSGSNRILALMKRKYNRDQAMRAIELLRKEIPRVQFTTDVIVGFPGETEDDFLDTYDFVKRARFLNVHIFPYSKREGTPAAVMKEQIPEEIKKERLHRLEALVAEIRKEILEKEIAESPIKEVLIETVKDGTAVGHTAEFIEVCLPASCETCHRNVSVRLQKTDGQICFGELV